MDEVPITGAPKRVYKSVNTARTPGTGPQTGSAYATSNSNRINRLRVVQRNLTALGFSLALACALTAATADATSIGGFFYPELRPASRAESDSAEGSRTAAGAFVCRPINRA
jgi:hypothetical protein